MLSNNLIKFLSNNEGTLNIIKNAPESDEEFRKIIKEIIIKESKILKNIILGKDIINSMKAGYKNAILGYLHSAEENNRFIIERASLIVFIKNTTKKYYKALKNMDWHKLVDDSFIIRSGGEAFGKIRKYIDIKEINKYTIYLAGNPVCEKHLKWKEYSISINKLYKKFEFKREIKCKYCNKKAKYFTLCMPKASALIYLACKIVNKNPNNLLKIYSNISRILHPYGFTDLNEDIVFSIWARDLLLIIIEINNLLFPDKYNEKIYPIDLVKNYKNILKS
ncbi:hypothetical protein YN1_8110 [Nanoarchaeota archaeon]